MRFRNAICYWHSGIAVIQWVYKYKTELRKEASCPHRRTASLSNVEPDLLGIISEYFPAYQRLDISVVDPAVWKLCKSVRIQSRLVENSFKVGFGWRWKRLKECTGVTHLKSQHVGGRGSRMVWSVSRTVCPGWHQTLILLISTSWVARITGVSH
jgi:hypothetical protein